MAIDSAAKRASVINTAWAGGILPLPPPTGSVTAADKSHMLSLYSGILLATFLSGVIVYVDGRVPLPAIEGMFPVNKVRGQVPPYQVTGVV